MNRDDLKGMVWVAVLLLVIGFGFWAHFEAPCGLYKYAKAGEVPARCLMK